MPRIGLFEPRPLLPSADPGVARSLVWGMPWRSNVAWIGQAYCVGGKSLYRGGWCPRLLASDLGAWPPSVAAYLNTHYATLEQQTGVDIKTDFIQGALFTLLSARANAALGRSIAEFERRRGASPRRARRSARGGPVQLRVNSAA